MESLTPGDPVSQIANVHTTFNVITTLLLLPFGNLMANAAVKILPGSDEDESAQFTPQYLHMPDSRINHQVGQVSVVLKNLENEINRMFRMVEENVERAFLQWLKATAP